MNKADIIAALKDVPDNSPVVLDLGIHTLLELEVLVDVGAGARVVLADDDEGREMIEVIQAAFR